MKNIYYAKFIPKRYKSKKFEKIKPILESARKKTKPRKLDLYEIFCGVLYVLKSGCQWRMLPQEFPKWRNCYDYFKKWSEKSDKSGESVLEIVLKKINWRGPTKQWSERENQLLCYRFSKREERGYC